MPHPVRDFQHDHRELNERVLAIGALTPRAPMRT